MTSFAYDPAVGERITLVLGALALSYVIAPAPFRWLWGVVTKALSRLSRGMKVLILATLGAGYVGAVLGYSWGLDTAVAGFFVGVVFVLFIVSAVV